MTTASGESTATGISLTCPICGFPFTPKPGDHQLQDERHAGLFICERCTSSKLAGWGCSLCDGPVRVPPAGPPFSSGPHKGRYWCGDCWTLYWAEHPGDLADEASRHYVYTQKRLIKMRREKKDRLESAGKLSEAIFEDEGSHVFLTERGTFHFSLALPEGMAPDEYDASRFRMLIKAVRAIAVKFPGYEEAFAPR